MAERSKNISNKSMNALLRHYGVLRGKQHVRNILRGMNADASFLPCDVVSWITTHDLTREGRKFHARYVLKIPLEGENVSCIDGRLFRLKKGCALLIFPYQIHSNPPVPDERKKAGEILIITFSLAHAGGQRLAGLRNRVIPIIPAWKERLCRIIGAYQGNGTVSSAEAVYALAGILSEMAAAYPETDRVEIQPGDVEKICAYITEHYREPLNVKTIADHFSVSPSTIQRQFRQALGPGVTPARFLENIRLRHAVELLLHSRKTAAEIADECGFRDPFGFSRAFRRLTGMPPRSFRQRGGI